MKFKFFLKKPPSTVGLDVFGYIVNFVFAAWACSIPGHKRELKRAAGFQITALARCFLKLLHQQSWRAALAWHTCGLRQTRLLLGSSGHRSDCEIGHSKPSAPQSGFLLCFVTTTVSILRTQSPIAASALRSCLYIPPL